MSSSETATLVTILSVLGAIFIICGILALAARLPMNPFVGIRIPSTMMSDAAWKAGHRAAGPYLIVGGLCAFAGGALAIAAPSIGTLALTLIPTAAVLVFLTIAVILASRAATRASIE
ncbi:hypothetical protein C6401_03585 [Arthrobacter woluwensis]|uniref:SdpI family protein n=1 Tax=Arthrobacter woluwensis TaxID=156980 RepID=UPI000D12AACC|nr:SdpI family protein [Arthrobacter woluwensis]PSS45198.1 hypothetical protein C6401_03585 [Arthrobacter woluwensis]